jgi:prepilin signal peptidase PulO-like enzyme (type II secretory pathway)
MLVDRTPIEGQPSDGTMLRPLRSRCPGCGTQLAWRELIPVVSYVALRGICRTCRNRIGTRTLVIEALTPALFAAFALGVLMVRGYAVWAALAGFGYATLSWLLVAVPMLLESRRPKPGFLVLGIGLLAALCLTAIFMALDTFTAAA